MTVCVLVDLLEYHLVSPITILSRQGRSSQNLGGRPEGSSGRAVDLLIPGLCDLGALFLGGRLPGWTPRKTPRKDSQMQPDALQGEERTRLVADLDGCSY